MKFKMWTGCDRGLCHQACGRSDKQLNTFDWLEDIPGNTDTTDLVEVQFKTHARDITTMLTILTCIKEILLQWKQILDTISE